MASVKSLGIQTPSALPYLIEEGILPSDPAPTSYTWKRYPIRNGRENYDEEELLITGTSVAWSRGSVLQKFFRLDREKEPVRDAIFAHFNDDDAARQTAPEATGGPASSGPAPTLTIRKRPHPTTPLPHRSAGAPTWAAAEQAEYVVTPLKEDKRALVVLLKRQMHVIFLAGSTHLVPLPFPVAAIFALPSGVALQRELPEEVLINRSHSMPQAPYNSFAMSQLTTSVAMPSQGQDQDDPPLIRKMLANVLGKDQHPQSSTAPAHFYLRDPIADIEPLGESMHSETLQMKGASTSSARKLDPNEQLLYTSSRDELSWNGVGPVDHSLLVAVTVNTMTGLYTVWQFSEQRQRVTTRRNRDISDTMSKEKYRASFGPGTGATTPVVRKSIGPRESFGKPRESMHDRNAIQDDADIALQLDPAFENPSAPSRSSRRISSLIARSETHGTRDHANAAELASSHSQMGGTRRGPSFGGRASRKSFSSLGHERPRVGTSSHTELDDLPDDETMADSDDDLPTPVPTDPTPASWMDTRRLVLSKIYSIPAQSLRSKHLSYSELLAAQSIFTFRPAPGHASSGDSSLVTLCVMSHLDNTFHVLELALPLNHTSRKGSSLKFGKIFKVKRCLSLPQIRDACLVGDPTCSRIVTLRKDGSESQLSLQSPGTPNFIINLPTRMLMVNPYQVEQESVIRKRRDGGFRRVLSTGPDELCRLQSSAASGQFCVLDSEQVCYRIQLHLTPVDTLVKRAILACEHALPSDPEEGDLMLRVWWELMVLLASKIGEVEDLEWRAFVATVFSLYVPFLDKPKDTKPTRTRRKGVFLRSSSGAQVDLESFEEAMLTECSIGNATASWLMEDTWAWVLNEDAVAGRRTSSQHKTRRSTASADGASSGIIRKRTLLEECLDLAREFYRSDAGTSAFGETGYLPVAQHSSPGQKSESLKNILVALHLLREEQKLDVMASAHVHALTPLLCQLGTWLEWEDWNSRATSFYMTESVEMDRWTFDNSQMRAAREVPPPFDPPSILQHVEDTCNGNSGRPFPTLADFSGGQSSKSRGAAVSKLTPRTSLLLELLQFQDSGPTSFIRIMGDSSLSAQILETFPEGVAASLRSVVVSCQANPGASFPPRVLDLIDRPDLDLLQNPDIAIFSRARYVGNTQHEAIRDFNSICRSTLDPETTSTQEGSAEEDRSLVTKLLFSDDQRFGEAARILHPLKHAMAKCVPEPDWTDTELLEAQQELAKIVASRTLSVSPGRAMLYYNARYPLLTEKFPIHGFSLGCLMKPSNTVVTADRNIYTEERVSWAFFHAGVEAGLSISRDAKGIDTSWISYNKPADLGNRHAGFLLALGLNGHLKSIAKWVAFKYLTPKHTMTSIGLLLGLAASYLGTMDTLITRLLSVHVTRMLPIGAAEMNLSPLTQTTGIMGIGLLYCNTQHRRMSEVMISEIESTEQDDIINPLENLRDEGYRLAAGFALGYINLGQGRNLNGMRDMHIVEHLLTLSVATKRVDLVHILDKATTAAVVALALIFMKTEEWTLASKIDIPDTVHQFEYVRPDLFLLRTVARHLIMWKGITPTFSWVKQQLPPSLRDMYKMNRGMGLHSEHLPLFNIVAGLCLSIGLKYAGSAREDVRDLLCHYLDCFMKAVSMVGSSYDEKLTRIGARNCQDAIALAAAAVMAGTGDITLLKRFRVLHGRTDVETHYGSHLAAHQAIGVLFLGGGTHTFNTSNIGVASLLCAFYPLFPTSVLDNRSHLQAFRHFWVFAAEPRCLVPRSVESRRPMNLDVLVTLRSGEELHRTAPCLLPELENIAHIASNDPRYWPISFDFANNPQHLAVFRQHQSLYVRARGAYNQGLSVFSATMRALNDRQMSFQRRRDAFEWIFSLSALAKLDHATQALVLPIEGSGSSGALAALLLGAGRSTAVDDRLALEHGCLRSGRAERLWSLRVLFAWEDKMRRVGAYDIAWLGQEVINMLRAGVALLGRRELGEA